jgi:hypothetical protein
MKYQQKGVPPEKAQCLETRKIQRTEIAGILRVPPHMIGDLEHATFSNIEHQQIAFVVHTMRPWFVRWEQSIHMHLLGSLEKERYYLVDALLRGDILSRFQAYAIARQWGWMSADDIRQLENMNPLPAGQGQTYLTPLNMIPADQVGQEQAETAVALPAANAHYRLLAEEAAGRVVRKEIAAMTRAEQKANGNNYAWDVAVNEFYDDHAGFVSQTMRIPLEAAWRYTEDGRDELLAQGAAAMEDWQPRRVMALADLAIGEL